MKPRIAVFANKGSAQAAQIAEAVRDQGGIPELLDLRIGGTAADSTEPAMTLAPGVARWGGVDFKDIRAIHIRCTTPRTLPTLPAVLNPVSHAEQRTRFLGEQAFNAATYAFFEHLAAGGRLVVNPLTSAYIDHNSKGQLYDKLRAAGFNAPRTLSTNCPDTALRFFDEVGEAVLKPAIGIGSTRVVSAWDRERLDELLACPTLFQERIPGETLRIHIVGDSMVLALRLISDDIDSRTMTKDFIPVELDPVEAAAIVRANRMLGLHYAAWDAIAGPDGRLSYLDCNPGPFVMWLPEASRRLVFAKLARYLTVFANTGSVAEASAAVADAA